MDCQRAGKLMVILLASMILVHANAQATAETNMVFYMHDLVSGAKVTAIPVAGVKGPQSNVAGFGTIMVIDDLVTEGPDIQSKQLGRAQGIYTNSALDGTDFHLTFSVVFTEGNYKGSTLEIQGADRYLQQKREVSVVSGTGAFRFAKGYAILETSLLNTTSAVIKFSVTVTHQA